MPSSVITNPDRVAALRRLMLLDAPPNPTFDRLTFLAAELLEAQIALLTLVDAERQVFLSAFGLPEPLRSTRQTPVGYSICQGALTTGRPLIVDDVGRHPALADNPAAIDLGMTSYVGVPLVTGGGHAVGCLCVMDSVPRDWADDGLAFLATLADITMDEIRLHFHERLAVHRREWAGVSGAGFGYRSSD